MRATAGRRLRHEREQRLSIAPEQNGKTAAAGDRVPKVVSGDGQGVARNLAERLRRHAIGAKEDRQTHEPLVADDGALGSGATAHDADDRHRGTLREVNALDGLVVLVDGLPELELLPTQEGSELRMFRLGKRGQKAVARSHPRSIEEPLSLRRRSDTRHLDVSTRCPRFRRTVVVSFYQGALMRAL